MISRYSLSLNKPNIPEDNIVAERMAVRAVFMVSCVPARCHLATDTDISPASSSCSPQGREVWTEQEMISLIAITGNKRDAITTLSLDAADIQTVNSKSQP